MEGFGIIAHDPLSAAFEIREQLVSEKRRIAFFFGAGTSMAVGIPGIEELTKQVSEQIEGPSKESFDKIKSKLPKNANIESIINRIRIYRELIGESEEAEYDGIKGAKAAKALDSAICHTISDIIGSKPLKSLEPHNRFAQWLRSLCFNRNYPVEIFTTNYDLLFEKSMEKFGIPFFDGFIGSVNPFFLPESVDAEFDGINDISCPPKSWTRLWKIHGSINWYKQNDSEENDGVITRLSKLKPKEEEELLIYPTRDKYTQSRKLPFIAFQDRLHRFISSGERLLIVIGYSFSDEHLNEIIFQGLRSNPRLAVTSFVYGGLSGRLEEYCRVHRNLAIYGSDKASVGGLSAKWNIISNENAENCDSFWDLEKKQFKLGDFNCFALFLEEFIGFKSAINDQTPNLASNSKNAKVENEGS